MSKHTADLPFVGTIGSVTVFRLFGEYYVRARSSLTARRVKTDPAFQKTRAFAALLAKASRIASQVYASVPHRRRKTNLFRQLTGQAITWLKYDWTESDIIQFLMQQYTGKQLPVKGPLTQSTAARASTPAISPTPTIQEGAPLKARPTKKAPKREPLYAINRKMNVTRCADSSPGSSTPPSPIVC